MRYDDPELRERLAAEYALGTLRGAARRRFERLMVQDPALRERATDWELRLNALAESAPAVEPPARLWARIAGALPAERRPARPSLARRLWESLPLWRGLGLAGSAAAALLALHVATRSPEPAGPSHVAVLSDPAFQPVLLASLDPAAGALTVRPVTLEPAGPDRSLELWLVPAGGGPPRSLGLLEQAEQTFPLARQDLADLAGGALAISLEPAGGSPTGQATGPVLYAGPVLPAD